jgi:protein-disulfide isomerase
MLGLMVAGCHAQSSPTVANGQVSPELSRRIEVMIRNHSEIPPEYVMAISSVKPSEIPGYNEIAVTFSKDGTPSRAINFLLSTDGKTLARWDKFDIGKDPKSDVPAPAARPARGGPASAPVQIVGFDDLECPFCARMNAELFPALIDRYKDQVHVVYLDFPLSIHPWAMRAAVDANCLVAANGTAYWNYVDYVHAHASEIGGQPPNLAKAEAELDKLALDEGAKQKMDTGALSACLKKQDESAVRTSMKEGDDLKVDATPVLYINGEKVEGVTPIENIYRIVDQALVAAGKTPPPPYKSPEAAPAPGSATQGGTGAGKPGN